MKYKKYLMRHMDNYLIEVEYKILTVQTEILEPRTKQTNKIRVKAI